jgi:hypothetical protein
MIEVSVFAYPGPRLWRDCAGPLAAGVFVDLKAGIWNLEFVIWNFPEGVDVRAG